MILPYANDITLLIRLGRTYIYIIFRLCISKIKSFRIENVRIRLKCLIYMLYII